MTRVMKMNMNTDEESDHDRDDDDDEQYLDIADDQFMDNDDEHDRDDDDDDDDDELVIDDENKNDRDNDDDDDDDTDDEDKHDTYDDELRDITPVFTPCKLYVFNNMLEDVTFEHKSTEIAVTRCPAQSEPNSFNNKKCAILIHDPNKSLTERLLSFVSNNFCGSTGHSFPLRFT